MTAEVPAMNDKQIERFIYRQALFVRRGLSEQRAEALADRLVLRDYERDDRRVCAECAHFQKESPKRHQKAWGNRCFKASRGELANTSRQHDPMLEILQRCEGFAFQTP